MRRIFTVLLVSLAAPCLYAQLSAQPETWAVLSGQPLAAADASETMFLALEVRAKLTANSLAKKPNIEVMPLAELAFQMLSRGDLDGSFRLFTRLNALLRGKTPGEWLELASALRFQLDRSICAAGAIAHARVSPIFDPGYALRAQYSLRVSVLDAKGVERKTIPVKPFEVFEPREFTIPTAGLGEGDYRVRFDLLDKDGNSIAHALRSLYINNSAMARVKAMQQQLERIVLSGVAQKSPRHGVAVQSLEYLINLYVRAAREPVEGFEQSLSPLVSAQDSKELTGYSTMPIQPGRDLAYAESLAAQLLKGESPLESVKKSMRVAYRSSEDQSLQPYRLFLPPNYSTDKKWPLLVAIHPEAGDEGTFFERYLMPNGSSAMEHYAAERGYVVVTPSLRGPFGHLLDKTDLGVHEMVAEASRAFSIDPGKIFLMGHMQGGAAMLRISLEGKTQLAGLANVAGVPMRQLEYSKAPQIPLLFLMGGADTSVAPDEARRLGLLLELRFKKFDYLELEKEDHASIGNAAFPLVFDFFDSVRDGKWKPSGRQIPLPKSR